jgi:hypothetical protein
MMNYTKEQLDMMAQQAMQNLGQRDQYAEFREDGVTPEEVEKAEDEYFKIEETPSIPEKEEQQEEVNINDDVAELDPYDEVLWENGPTQTDIDILKKQYSKYEVSACEIVNEYFIFRTLNRYEYKQLVARQNTNQLVREELICEACVLWPSEYDFRNMASGKGGVPSTLAEIIMRQSGFTQEFNIQIL